MESNKLNRKIYKTAMVNHVGRYLEGTGFAVAWCTGKTLDNFIAMFPQVK